MENENDPSVTPNPDGTFTLRSSSAVVVLSLKQVDELIHQLGKARSTHPDEVGHNPPWGDALQQVPLRHPTEHPRIWHGQSPPFADGGAMLGFRHPGLGWLPFLLGKDQALDLGHELIRRVSSGVVPTNGRAGLDQAS